MPQPARSASKAKANAKAGAKGKGQIKAKASPALGAPAAQAAPAAPPAASGLTHFNAQGQAHMVDVAGKPATHRVAVAGGRITMRPETLALIESGTAKKGDVLGIARIAAIQAAKRTADLIPLCHPLALTRVAVELQPFRPAGAGAGAGAGKRTRAAVCGVECTATVETLGQTGVEMEALSAVAVGLLTVYDMCKAVDRAMTMSDVRLLEKSGGKSGPFRAAGRQPKS